MHIGNFNHKINVSTEFYQLSIEDESSANLLAKENKFRQACYFIIQAMEKAIRSKIFILVNPNIEYFRNRNRTHSIDSAIEFLIEIISNDKIIQNQVSKQLNFYVLGNTKYEYLHNNLRYPSYFKKYDSYSILNVGLKDFKELNKRLQLLRKFLNDLDKF
jgi:HEPN domain-containing protein